MTLADPALALNMDAESAGSVQGSLIGISQGAILTHGVIDNAIYTDGNNQFVDFGRHPQQCFHDPDQCIQGVTYALWMRPSSSGTILDSGGFRFDSKGYLIHITSGGTLKVLSKFTDAYDYYEIRNWRRDHWKHIVFTWSRQGGTRLFINGCDADPHDVLGYYSPKERREPVVLDFSLTIGAAKNGTFAHCEVLVDELYAWHEILQPPQIWKLYTRGGLP